MNKYIKPAIWEVQLQQSCALLEASIYNVDTNLGEDTFIIGGGGDGEANTREWVEE